MKFIDERLQNSFKNILDCFCGADGGVRFVRFEMMLHGFEQQVLEKNDPSAKMLLNMVHQFSRLIDVANTRSFHKE